MGKIIIGLLVFILGVAFLFGAAMMNRSDMIDHKSDRDIQYLQWALGYFVDTRTNLCFAKTSVDTLTSVPCTPEVLKLAKQIK